jgi:glycosyltransferase involved in cell wall biosynthesis
MLQPVSIIIPTKNRAPLIRELLEGLKSLRRLAQIQPQIVVADNASSDETWKILQAASENFPVQLTPVKVSKPGKSAAINEAVHSAHGARLAFLDDDVIPDPGWLEAIERFIDTGTYAVGQGRIELESPVGEDPEIQKLNQRFRTIPRLEFDSSIERLHSLNGANFVICRSALEQVGLFDDRLGPGASGTSEDVELARRLTRAGITIGYIPDAIAFHRVDRARLTENYFKSIHKKQGQSRLVFKDLTVPHILFDLCRTAVQYGIDSLVSEERRRYRSKGRVYHYLGMLEAKLNGYPENRGDAKSLANCANDSAVKRVNAPYSAGPPNPKD